MYGRIRPCIPSLKFSSPSKCSKKGTGKVVKTIRLTDVSGYVAVHFEFNADGTEVWASL